MIKKINNKGMTLVELIAAFVITSVIVVTVFGSVMSYKNRAQTLSIKKEIIGYKNTVIQAIQNDIIQYGIKKAYKNNISNISTDTIFIVLSDGRTKQLDIVHGYQNQSSTITRSYIRYDDSIKQENGTFKEQEIRYYLPYYGDIKDKTGKFKHSAVRFGQSAITNIRPDNEYSKEATVIKITIPIYFGEGLNQDITILAPINYSVCY